MNKKKIIKHKIIDTIFAHTLKLPSFGDILDLPLIMPLYILGSRLLLLLSIKQFINILNFEILLVLFQFIFDTKNVNYQFTSLKI